MSSYVDDDDTIDLLDVLTDLVTVSINSNYRYMIPVTDALTQGMSDLIALQQLRDKLTHTCCDVLSQSGVFLGIVNKSATSKSQSQSG